MYKGRVKEDPYGPYPTVTDPRQDEVSLELFPGDFLPFSPTFLLSSICF